MFLDNIVSKALFWFNSLEEELSEKKAERAEEDAKYRKERLAQDLLAASSGTAESFGRIFKMVFGKEIKDLAPQYQAMYADALKSDASKLKHGELAKLKSELPGLSTGSDYEHQKLANHLGLTLGIADGYSVNDLKNLLTERKGSLQA